MSSLFRFRRILALMLVVLLSMPVGSVAQTRSSSSASSSSKRTEVKIWKDITPATYHYQTYKQNGKYWLRRASVCTSCHGTGKCPYCGGTGKRFVIEYFVPCNEKCGLCRGVGYRESLWDHEIWSLVRSKDTPFTREDILETLRQRSSGSYVPATPSGGTSGSSRSSSGGSAYSNNYCEVCHGTGHCSNQYGTVGWCNGDGKCYYCLGNGTLEGNYGPSACPICHGTGKCKHCHGTGKCSAGGGTGKKR